MLTLPDRAERRRIIHLIHRTKDKEHCRRLNAILGFQAGTPDFSGKLAKPVLVRVVAKQLFYGTGTPLAEIPGLHSQNMRDKPCRIVSAAGNFACDLFRQNFRGFRLTTP